MCGLISFLGKKGYNQEIARDFLLDQFDSQRSRGTQGFGLIRADKTVTKIRRSESELKALIDITMVKEPILMFHHRTPTSTPNYVGQTHPIFVSHPELKYDWYIQHNGVIANSKTLQEDHKEKLGYEYTTLIEEEVSIYTKATIVKFNDSESLAIELARYFEGKSMEVRTAGSAAFQGVALDKKTGLIVKIFWGRNATGAQLLYDETPEGIVIASELDLGYDIIDSTANFLDAKLLFEAGKNKELLKELKTSGIIFKPLVAEVPVFQQTSFPTAWQTPERKEEKKEDTTKSSEKTENTKTTENTKSKEIPQGYTAREWALRKMAERNLKEMTEAFIEFFASETAYATEKEILTAKDNFLDNVEMLLDDLLERAEVIKSQFEKKEQQEMEEEARKDIEGDLTNAELEELEYLTARDEEDMNIYSVSSPDFSDEGEADTLAINHGVYQLDENNEPTEIRPEDYVFNKGNIPSGIEAHAIRTSKTIYGRKPLSH